MGIKRGDVALFRGRISIHLLPQFFAIYSFYFKLCDTLNFEVNKVTSLILYIITYVQNTNISIPTIIINENNVT